MPHGWDLHPRLDILVKLNHHAACQGVRARIRLGFHLYRVACACHVDCGVACVGL